MLMQLGTSKTSVVANAMIESIQPFLGSEIVDWHAHRWLYAFAKKSFKNSILS